MEVTVRNRGQGAILRRIVTGVEIAGARRLRVHHRQFIISRIDARHGSSGIIPLELEGAVVTNDFPVYDCNSEVVLPDFLGWYARTTRFVDACRHASEGSTNRVRLKEPEFLRISMPVPPVREQQSIVAKLDLSASRINRSVTARDLAARDADALFGRALASAFDGLFDTSVVRTLGDACATASGGTPSRGDPSLFGGTVPWAKSGELKDDVLLATEETITEEALTKSSAKIFPCGTLLVAMYGATIGRTAVLGIGAATNQAVCAVVPDDSLDRDYVWWFLRRMRPVFSAAGFGGAQPNISQRLIRETRIPVPTLTRQRKVVARLDHLSTQAQRLTQSDVFVRRRLKALAASQLDYAFRQHDSA